MMKDLQVEEDEILVLYDVQASKISKKKKKCVPFNIINVIDIIYETMDNDETSKKTMTGYHHVTDLLNLPCVQ